MVQADEIRQNGDAFCVPLCELGRAGLGDDLLGVIVPYPEVGGVLAHADHLERDGVVLRPDDSRGGEVRGL